MYKIETMPLPKERKIGEYIKELYATYDREEAKDKIFRLTFPYGIRELKRHANMTSIEDGLADMSVAFMKTFNNFDPDKPGASFMNYYKLSIKTEVICTKFRNYRHSDKWMEVCYKIENRMDYLDTPIYDKDDTDAGTKANAIPDDVDITRDILHEEFENTIYKILDKVFEMTNYHKAKDKDVFTSYIESCFKEDKPLPYTKLAEKYELQPRAVGRICKKHLPIFINLWREEYENR